MGLHPLRVMRFPPAGSPVDDPEFQKAVVQSRAQAKLSPRSGRRCVFPLPSSPPLPHSLSLYPRCVAGPHTALVLLVTLPLRAAGSAQRLWTSSRGTTSSSSTCLTPSGSGACAPRPVCRPHRPSPCAALPAACTRWGSCPRECRLPPAPACPCPAGPPALPSRFTWGPRPHPRTRPYRRHPASTTGTRSYASWRGGSGRGPRWRSTSARAQ